MTEKSKSNAFIINDKNRNEVVAYGFVNPSNCEGTYTYFETSSQYLDLDYKYNLILMYLLYWKTGIYSARLVNYANIIDSNGKILSYQDTTVFKDAIKIQEYSYGEFIIKDSQVYFRINILKSGVECYLGEIPLVNLYNTPKKISY